MTLSHVVVDGSNIATEGRTKPSLKQLDEAIEQFGIKHPEADITVIVDATFGHRISSTEKDDYEARVLDGSIVAPPAGVVGRGDAFILQVAEKANAAVFSNDSFQEFHGEHTWLFEEDRLWGGKPVTGVGWVFVARTPVRGSVSRKAVKEAKTDSKSNSPASKKAAPARRSAPSKRAASSGNTASGDPKPKVGDSKPASSKASSPAPSRASKQTDRAATPSSSNGGRSDSSSGSTKRRSSTPSPVNSPSDFLSFIGEHQPGDTVTGTVVEFSSHGAYLLVGSTKAYLPLKALGDPPPNRARDFMSMGEELTLVVEGYDPPLRSVDLRLPDGETLSPSSDADQDPSVPAEQAEVEQAPVRKAPAKKAAAKAPARRAPAKKAPAKKAPAKKAAAKAPAKRAPAKKAPAKKAAAKAPAKRAPAKKAPAKKAPAKKAPVKKAAAKAPAKRAPAKKASPTEAEAKKAPASKAAVEKAPSTRTPAKKAPAKGSAQRAPAKRAPAKAPAKKAVAQQASTETGGPVRSEHAKRTAAARAHLD